jgi:hypothetical protein
MRRLVNGAVVAMAVLAMAGAPGAAQVRTVDPNSAIDADLAPQRAPTPPPGPREDLSEVVDAGPQDAAAAPDSPPRTAESAPAAGTANAGDTYQREDLIAAAEGVFGKGAAGLGGMVEKLLKEQGEPNAYIAGREASGAFVVGLRYGSGLMTHRVEGQRPVYWTGPSVGFDVGGDANKVFVLVYNLYDTQDLYKRFPAAEGRLYFVGGFSATYLRRGNIVLIPIRLGVGWRAGANVGYMRLSEKARWLPF